MKLQLIACAVATAITSSSFADIVSATEDFSGYSSGTDSTWWVYGTFGGISDIQTDGTNSLGIGDGVYDLNWNGNPSLQNALYNNHWDESTFINFHEGYEWNTFTGIFSAAWDDINDAQVTFSFVNTNTGEYTNVNIDLTNNFDTLAELSFSTSHNFNRVVITGDYVVMDNLIVTIPAPATLALLSVAGFTIRRRRS